MYVRTRGFGQTSSSSDSQPSFGSQLASYAGAISSLVGVGIAIANLFKGCGQTCIQATSIATQVGSLLDQNFTTYISLPIRSASVQAAALSVFDQTWAMLLQSCGNPQLGAAGQRCITDRQRGACTWKASKGGWNSDGTYTQWGKAGSGSDCWNWFIGMRDPIANDPFVQPDPTPASVGASFSSASQSVASSLSGIPTPLLVAAGLGVVALFLGGRN